MAEMKMEETLIQEVQIPEVSEIFEQIQTLQQEAERKKQAVERFREQIREKQAEADKLREEAERCLSRGEDPMPVLDQAVQIENQVQSMRELLPHGEAKPDAGEQKKIEELQKRLDADLRRAINGSKVAAEAQSEFERKLRELYDLAQRWNRAQQATGQSFGSKARGNPLKVQDPELQRFAREALGNLRGPLV